MIKRILRNILANQRGFTLIEMVVAIAIGGAIAAVGSMATRQVITETARNNNHEIAVRQVQNAGRWITRDVQMAQSVATTEDADGLPVTLTWESWDDDPDDGIPPDEYQVAYSLEQVDDMQKLKREHYTNAALDSTMYVAKYVSSAETSCEFTEPVLSFTVSATVGGGSLQGIETRTFEVTSRPDSGSG